MNHAELQAAVVELARSYDVAVTVADGRRSTPGATDLVLIGRGRIAFAELKSEDGRRSQAQILFGNRVSMTGSAYHYTWRPSDLESGKIEDVLTRLQATL